MPNASRCLPTVKTDVARPTSVEPPPLISSASWLSVLPSADGKLLVSTCEAARTRSCRPPSAGTRLTGSSESPPSPPQPARAQTSSAASRNLLITANEGSRVRVCPRRSGVAGFLDGPLAHGLVVQTAPQVQARARAMRPPRLGQRLQLRGRGRALEPIRAHRRV